ncbi:type II secretion system F family protein [Dasania marina]|uniref:type II secretion system F family protein n=1 Tax=Dasania marina TaxID=471499 RepID=UPI0003625578|nr:type II secretion system F family protein [Dasania marina]
MATTIKTSTFIYKGTNKQGKEVNGQIQGSNQTMVKAQLRKQGVIAKSVKKKSKPLFSAGKKISPADVAIFTRQLATMMKAGVPLVQSFDIVAEGLDNPSMRDLVLEIKNDVASGSGFAPSIAKHPKYFDELFCSLIASGEQSGTLETMLDRVATYKEKSEALKAKIKKAMTYPIAILVIALVVTALLLIKVIPQFAQSFESFGADLPAFTKMVMGLSDFVIAWWMIILVGIIGSVFTLKEAIKRSEAVSYAADKIILKIPIIGDIIFNSIIARFARTLSTTFAAGVPLVDALEAVAGTAGNVIYKDAIIKIKDEVTTGTQLNQAIRASGLFPSMVLQMVAIGEESGALDTMLEKVATHFEDIVDNMVDGMTALLEPIIMAILGVLIGGLMIAMYLPIFMLGAAI